MKNQNNENLIGRREFLKGAAAVVLMAAMEKYMPKAEAAGVSDDVLYKSFVDAYADGEIGSAENIYGIKIKMGNVESFVMNDANNKPFIMNHYYNCIKNKQMSNWYTYYTDENQKHFLYNCETRLYEMSKNPNDTALAKTFLNDISDRMLITKNSTAEGDYSDFDPHYIPNVALYETVAEMVYVAWYYDVNNRLIPSVQNLRSNTKPADMGSDSFYCAQVIIDMLAGRSDTSDRSISERKSGYTKGNYQPELLKNLDRFAPNDEAKKMIIRDFYGIFSDEWLADYANTDIDHYRVLVNELVRDGLLQTTNSINQENSIERKLTLKKNN